MTPALREHVWQRAGGRCEYCHLPYPYDGARFAIDHIVARQRHGETKDENLALACLNCNANKGTNLSGIDPQSGEIVRLFDPRRDRWSEHFAWNGPILAGLTATGRATIDVLDINAVKRIRLRVLLLEEGVVF